MTTRTHARPRTVFLVTLCLVAGLMIGMVLAATWFAGNAKCAIEQGQRICVETSPDDGRNFVTESRP